MTVEFKGGHKDDPVTEVDRAVEAQVLERVKRDFPDHAVLGEEGTNHGAPGADLSGPSTRWTARPTSSTAGHLLLLDRVLWRGMPVVGPCFCAGVATAVPACTTRAGARRVSRAEPFRLEVTSLPVGSRVTSMPAGLTGVDGRRGRHQFGTARTLGSAAAELVLTAEGTFQVGVFHSLRIWDVAAGAALCREAARDVWTRPTAEGPGARSSTSAARPIARPAWTSCAAGTTGWRPASRACCRTCRRDLQRAQSPLAVARRMIFGKDD